MFGGNAASRGNYDICKNQTFSRLKISWYESLQQNNEWPKYCGETIVERAEMKLRCYP